MKFFAFIEPPVKLELCLSLSDVEETLAFNITAVVFTLLFELNLHFDFQKCSQVEGEHKGSPLSLYQSLIGWVSDRMRIQGLSPFCIQELVAVPCLCTMKIISLQRP